MDISEIIDLVPAQELALAERIHEAIVHFKKLRASSFWNVQTFRVSDIGLFLDKQQRECLVARIGFALSIPSEAAVLPLFVELPDDLEATDDETYAIATDFRRIKVGELVEIDFKGLKFVTVKRPTAEAA